MNNTLDFNEGGLLVSRGRFFPIGFILVGIVLIVVGLTLLANLNPFGLLALPAGLFIVFGQDGLKIDFARSRKKEFISLFGIRFGSWKSLHQMKYVEIKPGGINSGASLGGMASVSSTTFAYKVYLIAPRIKRSIIYAYPEKDEALILGNKLAEGLDLQLVDNTNVQGRK